MPGRSNRRNYCPKGLGATTTDATYGNFFLPGPDTVFEADNVLLVETADDVRVIPMPCASFPKSAISIASTPHRSRWLIDPEEETKAREDT